VWSTELVSVARLIDVLPAALGGALVAAFLGRVDRPLVVKLALGWASAAILAVLLVVAVSSSGGGPLGDLTAGPRRYALVVGVLAGMLQGVVGGWLTLRCVRLRR
jgi:hypothetical protein